MNILLWVLQVLVALPALNAGVFHLLLPENMPAMFAWMNDLGTVPHIIIGVLEIAAALGLLLPGLTKIQTRLTPLAAAGFALTMVGAVFFHIPRAEYQNVGLNVVLAVLAIFVAYGRWRLSPLKDRNAAA